MIELARKYLEIGLAGRKTLIDYYNQNVYPLIDKKRKYRKRGNCANIYTIW